MNQISSERHDHSPEEPQENVHDHDVYLEFLKKQVEYFPSLPEHMKYSYATNADLYDLMCLLVKILKKEDHSQ